MVYRNNEPYNDLPLLPPPETIETARVLRRCITASRALAELKGAGNLIPNQSILINSIPLQEARLSSEIENIVTTQDALFRAAVEEPGRADPQTREVLRYRTALRHGFDTLQSRPIGIDLMLELCAMLHDEPATLRDQEPILIEDVGAQAVVYTPPRGRSLIVALLRNLGAFLQEPSGLDPLIKMAVAHYQFEAIHPFVDGNGRTGRILNLLVLGTGRAVGNPCAVSQPVHHSEQGRILPPITGCHRRERLGGVADLHADRGGGDRAVDDRPHQGHPRSVRRDDGTLPARAARPGLLEGVDGADLHPAIRQDQVPDRCRYR